MSMTERIRNLIALMLLVLLVAVSFVSGFFANDFLETRRNKSYAQAQESSSFALFWEAWGHVENNFLGDLPSQQQLTYGAIRGAMNLLQDPYSFFVEPVVREQERESLQGSYGGIGATLVRPEEGGPVVLQPSTGNPADLAGVLMGDLLLAVDGREITPDMTVQDVAGLIRGEKGTAVVLTVLHSDQSEPIDIEVVRGDILIPSVSYHILPDNDTIGYIQLTRFSGESGNEIADALINLEEQGAEKLILDLRGNGGGLLDAAVDVADHFLDDGVVLYQLTRGQEEKTYYASRDGENNQMPLVILIDGGSASSSEILAGALHDRERAILLGSGPTFGKGSVQLVYDLSDGSSVHITASRWFTPDRHPIDGQGLSPDITVTVTQEDIDNGRDAVLLQAIETLEDE